GRTVMLIEPPHVPQIAAWASWSSQPSRLLWVQASRQADALWAAERALRSGAFGALLLWQGRMRAPALRRLQLAAQHGETLFFLVRPQALASQVSPAPLRLVLEPAN